ncbi:NPH3 domain-containing protein [Dioscorea alata]|uniref:NPH3 domain-containing protein n=1 Tax=Dioscorea alata TaxID=55571 RepID=A0ACB7VHH7_DIOAL|nr:NPH3 domain-containing protein [Dioscorea alata]
MATEKLSARGGQAWFCTTGLPSDVVIEVDEMSFHLHKFPLMSKSKKLHLLITQREQKQENRGEENEEEIREEELHRITLPHFPGGAETFEVAAKFCYGVKVELNAWTAAPLRCAAEYLEMTEEMMEENLISRTERYLTQSVLRNIKESIRALKSCEDLMPLAEDLGIPQRCVDAIAARACSSDPTSLFGWPISNGSDPKDPENATVLWNGIDTGARRKISSRSAAAAAADSWFEDLTVLSLPIYKRVIAAMKSRDPNPSAIEGSLISYAKSSIPGLSRSSRKPSSAPLTSETEQRELLETVITNLPLEKGSGSGRVTPRFLFGLLRTVNILRASDASRSTIEMMIGSQLEKATLDDLLIPSYSYLVDTLYDVECVERIVRHFVERHVERSTVEDDRAGIESPAGNDTAVMTVGRLVDGYLAEIASDANLKVEKFCDLALVLPDNARVYDDGLYRAVDLYLKAHPMLTEAEREKVCVVLDYHKLTLEACTHAAQNERLPLRAVVQVLFFEQLQLRRAVAGTVLASDPITLRTPERAGASSSVQPDESAAAREGGVPWRETVRENQVLKLDMDSMRARVRELERECARMKSALERMGRGARMRGLGLITKRFGCRIGAQVCDSRDLTVVASERKPETPRTP